MKRVDIVLLGLLGLMLCMGPEAFAQKIIIKGSNTFGEELGPRLIRAYRQVHPGVAIELEAKGSASGFAALLFQVVWTREFSSEPSRSED